jgi:hypothetical protein
MEALGSKFGTGRIRVRAYTVPSSYGTALYVGDPVIPVNTASTPSDSNIGSLPDVKVAVAGNNSGQIGAIVGINAAVSVTTPAIPTKVYIPASTGGIVLVCDDPDALYKMQENGASGSTISGTHIQTSVDFASGTGSTYTGFSGYVLASSTVTSGYNFRLEELYQGLDNALGVSAKWIVSLNLNPYRASQTML